MKFSHYRDDFILLASRDEKTGDQVYGQPGAKIVVYGQWSWPSMCFWLIPVD